MVGNVSGGEGRGGLEQDASNIESYVALRGGTHRIRKG